MNFSTSIQNAYQDRTSIGAYLTAPLQFYEHTIRPCFIKKIEESPNSCHSLAYKVSLVVAEIFAYVILGALSLVGTGLNLCSLVTVPQSTNEVSPERSDAPCLLNNGPASVDSVVSLPRSTNLAPVLNRILQDHQTPYTGPMFWSILTGNSIINFTADLRIKIENAHYLYDLQSRIPGNFSSLHAEDVRDRRETYNNNYQLNFQFSLDPETPETPETPDTL